MNRTSNRDWGTPRGVMFFYACGNLPTLPAGGTPFGGCCARASLWDTPAVRDRESHWKGESGCGKTTLLQILQRFYEPESGEIVLNDTIRWQDLPVKNWREKIASVPQQVKIFNGTLLDNICLGDTREEAERIVSFCEDLGFDRYFESFPQQYATLLGEEGANISGGQQQLVAFARALYQQPEMLLLDEATAAMDRETEQNMLNLLLRLKEKMGIILVTHRVQSARQADRIYIIEKGKIIRHGTAGELAAGDNLFSRSLADFAV